MTRELLNTLFIATPDAHVRLENETFRVELARQTLLRVPLIHLGSVILLGRVTITGEAMRRCAADGRNLAMLDQHGRFQCRVVGPTSGNVLLRKAQYDAHADPVRTQGIARMIVAAKLRNSRALLLRGAREAKDNQAAAELRSAAEQIAKLMESVSEATAIDEVRGLEGQGAHLYFQSFPHLLTVPPEEFAFRTRSRRPPRDRTNALLSLLYTLLTTDCTGATEGVGLDPQFGYLHVLRPGRPALALDLVEELRAALADRLVLTLINRREIRPHHFEERPGGGTLLTADGRKLVLAAYQQRKQRTTPHLLMKESVPLGLVPHLQARLLARYLRGDLEEYPPFLYQG